MVIVVDNDEWLSGGKDKINDGLMNCINQLMVYDEK